VLKWHFWKLFEITISAGQEVKKINASQKANNRNSMPGFFWLLSAKMKAGVKNKPSVARNTW
tara:strand:- start:442 stop:627 length:186 start_codon:yes stop_codon:yes gene_type:complete